MLKLYLVSILSFFILLPVAIAEKNVEMLVLNERRSDSRKVIRGIVTNALNKRGVKLDFRSFDADMSAALKRYHKEGGVADFRKKYLEREHRQLREDYIESMVTAFSRAVLRGREIVEIVHPDDDKRLKPVMQYYRTHKELSKMGTKNLRLIVFKNKRPDEVATTVSPYPIQNWFVVSITIQGGELKKGEKPVQIFPTVYHSGGEQLTATLLKTFYGGTDVIEIGEKFYRNASNMHLNLVLCEQLRHRYNWQRGPKVRFKTPRAKAVYEEMLAKKIGKEFVKYQKTQEFRKLTRQGMQIMKARYPKADESESAKRVEKAILRGFGASYILRMSPDLLKGKVELLGMAQEVYKVREEALVSLLLDIPQAYLKKEKPPVGEFVEYLYRAMVSEYKKQK